MNTEELLERQNDFIRRLLYVGAWGRDIGEQLIADYDAHRAAQAKETTNSAGAEGEATRFAAALSAFEDVYECGINLLSETFDDNKEDALKAAILAYENAAPVSLGNAPGDRVTADAIYQSVLQTILDLPDYTSPEDQPDVMMCTADELCMAIDRAFEKIKFAEPHPAPEANAPQSKDDGQAEMRSHLEWT